MTNLFVIAESGDKPGHYNIMLKHLFLCFKSEDGMLHPQLCVKADSTENAISIVMEKYEIVEDEAYL